jgi:NDP-sugar pyrophosphorylase family protein
VNAGVYVLSPQILKLLKNNEYLDMPELFQKSISSGLKNIAYPVHEQWLDVGKPDDYERAENLLNN